MPKGTIPLNEADTRAKLIDPALKKVGWEESLISREVQVTKGRLYLVGDQAHQRQPQTADYVLSVGGVPIAVIEAKDESHHVASGLQQGKKYAEMLDVRFAYSSNGHGFVEFDYLTNTEKMLSLSAFPSPDVLRARLQNQGEIPAAPGDPLYYPYNTALGMHPRYYQDVSVRRVLKAVRDKRQKILLALATGTGKTFIASQIAWKLYKTKRIKRVLFLTDRIFLRDQAYNAFSFFSGPDGDPRYVIDGELATHAELYFGIYQSLYAERDGERLFKHVPANFFDLIIIDECHRSGFGTWREILDYFGSATQLGLTATPKRSDNVDTYGYFGDPAYSYSLGQGIQDGFLATYKVHKVRTNLDQAGGVNVEDAVIAGAELFVPEGTDAVKDFYSVREFEKNITLPDWTAKICEHLAATLAQAGSMEKTIVFCVNMDHAAEVRQHLQNHFAHLGHSDYAVRIVSEEPYGAQDLEDFRDSYRQTPVIATTVDLLSTGVDIPSVRNIVFMKPVESVVVFKQILGRGSRLDAVIDKKWFRVIDYTNATRLFDEWDRPAGDVEELPPKPWNGVIKLEVIDSETAEPVPNAWAIAVAAPNEQVKFKREGNELVGSGLPERELTVHVGAGNYRGRQVKLAAMKPDEVQLAVVEIRSERQSTERIRLSGVEVEIASEITLTIDSTGQQMTVHEYVVHAGEVLRSHLGSRSVLRTTWLEPTARAELIAEMEREGVHLGLLADLLKAHDADGYDIVGHVAFGQPLIRRTERRDAFLHSNAAWLTSFAAAKRGIVMELVDSYLDGGIDQLARQILKLDRFKKHGGAVGAVKALGGSAGLDTVLTELAARIYPPLKEAA